MLSTKAAAIWNPAQGPQAEWGKRFLMTKLCTLVPNGSPGGTTWLVEAVIRALIRGKPRVLWENKPNLEVRKNSLGEDDDS